MAHDDEEQHGQGRPECGRPVIVDPASLSQEALRGVVEAFVLREGTDYGPQEAALERKVADVMRQIERREARIVFDPQTETVDIQVVPPRERRRS